MIVCERLRRRCFFIGGMAVAVQRLDSCSATPAGIGVDVEPARQVAPAAARLFLSMREHARATPRDWLRLWTIKEAAFKALQKAARSEALRLSFIARRELDVGKSDIALLLVIEAKNVLRLESVTETASTRRVLQPGQPAAPVLRRPACTRDLHQPVRITSD